MVGRPKDSGYRELDESLAVVVTASCRGTLSRPFNGAWAGLYQAKVLNARLCSHPSAKSSSRANAVPSDWPQPTKEILEIGT